ncbi:hypothetical protein D3C80_982390 [compost metagenome]
MGVDHVQQQVGIARLLERGAERLDQLVRQVTDEADGIGEDHRTDVVELQTAQGRIEGGEQLVGSEDVSLGQRIEQGRLAGVGIADQRDHRNLRALAPAPRQLALATHLLQALLDLANAHAQQAAVGFQLGLARTAQADTALLPLQVGPATHQTRAQVIQLGQLDLQLALVGARALGEDVENQTGTVQHATLEHPLEVALLTGRKGVIEDDQVGRVALDLIADLLDLAAADQEAGARLMPGNVDEANHLGACRTSQLEKLVGIFTRLGRLTFQMNQNGPVTALMALKEQDWRLRLFVVARFALLAAGQTDRTARNHGGNGVLVDHLADGVLQQDDELVERLDLTLQFDAVDQIDGDRNAFLTQGIQVRVL